MKKHLRHITQSFARPVWVWASLWAIVLLTTTIMPSRADDPFDPILGPRNPRPAAQAYLAKQSDITADDARDLLDNRPVAITTLQKLSVAPVREVRALVAGNSGISPELINQMAADDDAAVRQYAASNPAAPDALLKKLFNDKDGNVRWSVEHNPNWAGAIATMH